MIPEEKIINIKMLNEHLNDLIIAMYEVDNHANSRRVMKPDDHGNITIHNMKKYHFIGRDNSYYYEFGQFKKEFLINKKNNSNLASEKK